MNICSVASCFLILAKFCYVYWLVKNVRALLSDNSVKYVCKNFQIFDSIMYVLLNIKAQFKEMEVLRVIGI